MPLGEKFYLSETRLPVLEAGEEMLHSPSSFLHTLRRRRSVPYSISCIYQRASRALHENAAREEASDRASSWAGCMQTIQRSPLESETLQRFW
jgi:hypothetical protein